MSSFFKETLKARLYQNKAKYPLLKLDDLLDWQTMGDKLHRARARSRSDRRGNSGYDPLKMFKAVLLGQWHSLSDPELEHALAVRADFLVFCDFDDMELPDHSTLCRYRQWLMKGDLLKRLMAEINNQLEQQNLKISNATVAVVDASIIESMGAPRRKAMDVEENGEVTPTPASKDEDAKWVKKAGRFYLGYKLHASSDEEGYLEGIHVTPANAPESRHLTPLLDELPEGVELLADKGYSSKLNRAELNARGLKDGIMHKAVRGRQITADEQQRNNEIKSKRWVIEQTFGTLKRRFRFRQAKYFGQDKVLGQCYLKAMCLNLLKASNKVSYA
jgi:transposase, IS5 family